MQLSEKNIREKKFHNELQSKSKGRFENVFYKAIYNCNEDSQRGRVGARGRERAIGVRLHPSFPLHPL